MSIQRVLVVDDDSLSREFLTETVKGLGFRAESTSTAEQALEHLRRGGFDLAFTDLRMPGTNGVELARTIGREFPDLPLVVLTSHGTVETAIEALHNGAAEFLMKPVTAKALEVVVRRVARTLRLERENEYLRSEVALDFGDDVVAESHSMKEALKTADRVAASKGTVLITGESGTGKEQIAHFIHKKSARRDGPFIRVNCAALSEQLLESELFGHERGAFTGAHKRREGRFELADGGTLLLDEIAELSPSLQTKLLRALEEEKIERIGGNTKLEVDVRVIATTNRDLPRGIADGTFREDLYYRLHVLPIHVDPLRDRREDILPLAMHFSEVYAKANGVPSPVFSEEARQRLVEWNWPGNVRELANAIHRAVILVDGGEIQPDHMLFEPIPKVHGKPRFTLVTDKGDYLGAISASSPLANRQLADLEREAILCTLEATRGNKTEAARRLGVTARTLSNKMKLWRELGLVA